MSCHLCFSSILFDDTCRYYLSDGVYGSFNNIVFDHARPQPVLLQVGPVDAAQKQKMLTL